jgi:hypothetical protein
VPVVESAGCDQPSACRERKLVHLSLIHVCYLHEAGII